MSEWIFLLVGDCYNCIYKVPSEHVTYNCDTIDALTNITRIANGVCYAAVVHGTKTKHVKRRRITV